MKTSIIWIIDGLGHGGAERMTFSLLKQFDRERFDLRVCVLQVKQGNPVAKDLEHIGIPVDLVLIPNLRHPANLFKILRYLNKYKPDLVHTQLEFANVIGNIAAWILGIPSVSTLHTLEAPEKGTEYWRNQLDWVSLHYFCSRIIAVSDNARLHHIMHGRIPSKKIITMYNGIDLSAFRALDKHIRTEKRQSLNLTENSFVFCTIAVLREPKGIQFMLQAMPKIISAMPNAHYLVVGEGTYGEILREITKSLNLENHVTFTGQRTDIAEILSASDMFVLPTLKDALPTVLIEAMAAQKAIVASRVGGVPEIISDGVNGLLVQAKDPSSLSVNCLKVGKNPELRESMERAGLEIASNKFNIETQIESLSNVYQELVKHGR